MPESYQNMPHGYPFVLVVDEDSENLENFRTHLEGKRNFLALESPAEALSAVAEREVAAVVAEQSLQSPSGLELLKRTTEFSPRTVGILMSHAPKSSVLMKALNCGKVCYFLQKPVDSGKIDDFLDAAMEKYYARLRWEEHLTSLRRLIDYYKENNPAESAPGVEGDLSGVLEKIRDMVSSPSVPEEKEVAHSSKLPRKLADVEREEISAALKKAGGKKAAAARVLGINRSTLYYRMKRQGIVEP